MNYAQKRRRAYPEFGTETRFVSGQIMEERNRTKRNQLETELRAVESALTLFRSAIGIEARISSRELFSQ
jgi:hypothetical protein